MQFVIRVIDGEIELAAILWPNGNGIQFNKPELCGCKIVFVRRNKPVSVIDESHVLDEK